MTQLRSRNANVAIDGSHLENVHASAAGIGTRIGGVPLLRTLELEGVEIRVDQHESQADRAADQLLQFTAAIPTDDSIDLVAVGFTIGPLSITLNVLTLVGIGIVALVARSWL